MHLVRRSIMKPSFHLGEMVESLQCQASGFSRQRSILNQLLNIREMPVRLIGGNTDVNTRPHQTAAHGTGALEFIESQRKLPQFAEHLISWNSRVDQRGQKHIAADAGGAIQIS